MSAIQQYFENGRVFAARQKELRQKLLMKQTHLSTVEEVDTCEDEFLEFDTLLRRDWFVDDDDIIELVWDASEEAFVMIMNNLHTYSARVRSVLTNTFNMPKISQRVKMNVTCLTDDQLDHIETTKLKELSTKIEAAWQAYKKAHGLTRPENEVDDTYTELYEMLQEKKKTKELQNKSKKKYVAPSMRGKVEPVEPIDIEIQKLENEITNVQQKIKDEDQLWENGKKSELYKYLLLSLP